MNTMKHLVMALLIALVVPFVNAQVQVGDILCEGDTLVSPSDYENSDLEAIGVVFYVDNSGEHGWVVSLDNEGCCAWGGFGNDSSLDNLRSRVSASNDIDGYANTETMRSDSIYHPASEIVDFENGWYVPAVGQLKRLYSSFKEVNESLVKAGGVPFDPTGFNYWSSSEYSPNDAWYLSSIGGIDHTSNTFNDCKSTSKWVRSVRAF